jgi:hypothetical protein
MLLELELPRVLAPDLSSNCYSAVFLPTTHSDPYEVNSVEMVFLFAASPMYWEWAIFAPAALRRSSSHFSGSLSGIEP